MPDLPDVRKGLQAALGPPLDALDAVLQQAGAGAVAAASGAAAGVTQGLDGAIEGLSRLMVDAQWQVRWVHFYVHMLALTAVRHTTSAVHCSTCSLHMCGM